MVVSISKIPDVIKREYILRNVHESWIFREEVLFNTLAQLLQKDKRDASVKSKLNKRPMEVVPSEKQKR